MDLPSTQPTKAPSLRVREVHTFRRDVETRMPFHFGSVTLTSLSVLYAQARFELEGGRTLEGVGASVFSPMWFDKNPQRDFECRARDLLLSVHFAVDAYTEQPGRSAYAIHRDVQPKVRERCARLDISSLSSSFGVALIDSALVDGLCRHYEMTLHEGLRSDLFGFGEAPFLPDRPLSKIALRHTVGLGDPLIASDIDERLDDGLPESLDEVIAEYGGQYFKIKIKNDVAEAIERLVRIEEVLNEKAPESHAVLDGNEQFETMEAFSEFACALEGEPRLARFRERLLWIEQPVERDAALDTSVSNTLKELGPRFSIILDESDGTDEAVEEALRLGYKGISAKNCKGIFRTLHSTRVLHTHRHKNDGDLVLSAEDLTNPGVHPLHQDTCTVASLGIPHAERNGHHYIRGLSSLPSSEQEDALRDYPSLYERTPQGLVRLKIRDGFLDVNEVLQSGYGLKRPIDVSTLDALTLPREAPS